MLTEMDKGYHMRLSRSADANPQPGEDMEPELPCDEQAPEEHVSFDYSTSEAQEVFAHFSAAVETLRIAFRTGYASLEEAKSLLEIEKAALVETNSALTRENAMLAETNTTLKTSNTQLGNSHAGVMSCNEALERRLRFYEKTLGLAVLPVLFRRAALALVRQNDSTER